MTNRDYMSNSETINNHIKELCSRTGLGHGGHKAGMFCTTGDRGLRTRENFNGGSHGDGKEAEDC